MSGCEVCDMEGPNLPDVLIPRTEMTAVHRAAHGLGRALWATLTPPLERLLERITQ